jgi:hypothetical protein
LPVQITLPPRDFTYGGFVLEQGNQSGEKILSAEQTLALQFLPGCSPAHSCLNKAPVLLLGLHGLAAELAEKPIGSEKFRPPSPVSRALVARSGIFRRIIDYPGPNRIEHNITTEFEQIGLAIDQDRLEPALKKAPGPPVGGD